MGFTRKRTTIVRIPTEEINRIDKVWEERFKRGLVKKKEFTRTEAYRLLGRIPEYNLALNKLAILPKKEDIFSNVIKKKR